MKWLKYGLSTLLILGLTALMLVFPRFYYARADRQDAALKTRAIRLESTQDPLTAAETLRIFSENSANGIYTQVPLTGSTNEYAADCKAIVDDIFGASEQSPVANYLWQKLDSYESASIEARQFLTLSEGVIVRLTLISAQFDNLSFYYEQDTKAAIGFSFFIPYDDIEPDQTSKIIFQLEEGIETYVYYSTLGLQAWEFDYQIDALTESGVLFSASVREANEADAFS